MSPQQKADVITGTHGRALRRIAGATLYAADLPLPSHERVIRIAKLADAAARMVRDQTPCRRGCSACCHINLPLGRTEAERLAKASGRELTAANALPAMAAALLRDDTRFYGVPCPFLKNDECSVYRDRPIACRTHHVIEESAAKCAVDEGRRTDPIAKFNLSFFDEAAAVVMQHELVGDIRDWFPS